MYVLAVDTATPVCSAALVHGFHILAEFSLGTGKTHATHIMGMISNVLARCEMTLDQMDGFAVGRGPGSFTGLRIGVSTVKGLAAGSGKPLVGVSSLEALARQAYRKGYTICPMIDARRGEVYTTRFTAGRDGLIQCFPESVMSPEKALDGVDSPCIVVGSGAVAYRDHFLRVPGKNIEPAMSGQHQVRASTIALLSLDRFQRLPADSAGRVTPAYIRKSDAEYRLDRPVSAGSPGERCPDPA
jgi:tRNA threonylcarbamoyladenosine biosynthesis protein TsaB